ncbi:Riboflavin synthase-like beta-barrel [Kalmanozyma brasiliensis GHG001]|uniref:FAD-binding FR-type domain-containing protein n=1 Tax=Kalmanozyma brasiliensis (strain GHG001) TaxID=1365824 RepID=V5EW30_KALBG|nr:Riboflavin synthase-like beta-barrel [Kalmanozyma brasiliensis GHG001]EST06499.1 Riboflavin synthase-like beta-barrel [Kalmanozyma brasiliensis GHG001]
MNASHEWHAGELAIQTALGHKDAVAGAHSIFRPQLTAQHQQFFPALNILPVCTLDAQGRPWGSFLAASDGEAGFVKCPSFSSLIATGMRLHEDHPVEMALKEGAKFGMTSLVMGDDASYQGPGLKLIAGVGVMFDNRRRNKVAGFINERNTGSAEERSIQVEVLESLGNCPKYINTRRLVTNPQHSSKMLLKSLEINLGEGLPKETLEHVAQADAVFLATRYTSPVQTIFKSRLGINIRGGKPGFVRITTEEGRTVAYLPDYSGNRFMSSLGNIHNDRVAGLTIPLMQKGRPIDVVYLTGTAVVLLGKESSSIFPGVSTCVRIEVTGFMHVQDAVPLMADDFDPSDGVEDFEEKGEDGVGWSPYNPPVRRLRSELGDPSFDQGTANEATLIKFQAHTQTLATFTFRLAEPVRYRAGQHVILDCSSLLDSEVKEYKHMSDRRGGEQELNDSGVRTWTISSGPGSADELQVTMRRVDAGRVTPRMFELGAKGEEVKLPVLGVGGEFVLPKEKRRMVWVAAGVGFTPFLSFLSHLAKGTEQMDVTMVLAASRAEVGTLLRLIRTATAGAATTGKLVIHVVSAGLDSQTLTASQPDSSALDVTITHHDTRLNPQLLLDVCRGVEKAETWVCGPPVFETMVMQTLEEAGWSGESVHRESFAF